MDNRTELRLHNGLVIVRDDTNGVCVIEQRAPSDTGERVIAAWELGPDQCKAVRAHIGIGEEIAAVAKKK
jgi:hypothetical protein